MPTTNEYDVIIVGGGPGGATTGTLLRKYNPKLRVLVVEREVFPREHIGESQLPPISDVLNEMGCWEKVEGANFIIKLGATYTWGKTKEPWVFGFIPNEEIGNQKRPGKFEGWRKKVPFQVDRAIYDDILLKHTAEMGCEVRQGTAVLKVERQGDRITSLKLSDGSEVSAKHYVDASGNAAVIRRAMGVKVEAPSLLQNIAFWDYFERPGLNNSLLERTAIRIQIRSLPYGWMWYIALNPNRTSVGLVCPAEYFKKCGKTAEQIYADALTEEKSIAGYIKGARRDGTVRRTNDWSYHSERAYGENWYLCGETLGFADPILSAGMTLTHTCGRHLAYTINEIERGELDRNWLLEQYQHTQLRRVKQHIRFAEYWYSANDQFSAVRENCSAIAASTGLKLTAEEAFRWISYGGLDDHIGQVGLGGLDFSSIRGVQYRLHDAPEGSIEYEINGKNQFRLKLDGAEEVYVGDLRNGRVIRTPAYRRDGKTLTLAGGYAFLVQALKQTYKIDEIFGLIQSTAAHDVGKEGVPHVMSTVVQCLEHMVLDGWVKAYFKHGKPALSLKTPKEGKIIRTADAKGN